MGASTGERLGWLAVGVPVGAACPLCANADGNDCFLNVGAGVHSVSQGDAVRVARCGACRSASFPDLGEMENNYPAADPALLTSDFWLLIDHYVELVGGLDWRLAFAEQLPRVGARRVLEVGCNTGLLLDAIRRLWGTEVVGLEPSVYGLAGAQRFGLPIANEYTADLLARTTEQFDIVISTEVIEHVTDPAAFLRELRQLLRPGGHALVTTPNAEGLTPDRTSGEAYAMLSVGSHRAIFSAAMLRRLAMEAGFESVHIDAHPTTLIAVLGDRPGLRSSVDPRPLLHRYYDARIGDEALAGAPARHRLADLIARYNLARELDVPEATEGEASIDALLRDAFRVDVRDLGSLVAGAERARDIFDFGREAPFSMSRYLFHRGHRDDISEAERTEMWEAAVVLIGRGMAIDPVHLYLLESTLTDTLAALGGRPSGRWRTNAQAALAAAPELAGRNLPHVPLPWARRLKRAARKIVPSSR